MHRQAHTVTSLSQRREYISQTQRDMSDLVSSEEHVAGTMGFTAGQAAGSKLCLSYAHLSTGFNPCKEESRATVWKSFHCVEKPNNVIIHRRVESKPHVIYTHGQCRPLPASSFILICA